MAQRTTGSCKENKTNIESTAVDMWKTHQVYHIPTATTTTIDKGPQRNRTFLMGQYTDHF